MSERAGLWRAWLLAAAAIVAVFGASLVLLPETMARLLGALYFPSPPGPPLLGVRGDAYLMFVSAVLGAVMLGWAALLWLVVAGPLRPGEPEAWRMAAVSLAVWFVPDTAYSLWSGFWQNAVLNLALAALFAIPLAALRPLMRPRAKGSAT